MRFIVGGLLAILLVTAVVVAQSPAAAQDNLYYRGYFEGKVELLNKGVGWYTYKPDPNTAYPLFEQRHTSVWWHLIGPDDEKEEDESILNPSRTKVHTLTPLPGQYYYKKPAHYNFTTPMNNLGWPYRKYNSRY